MRTALFAVFSGDIDIWRHDIEIPKKFGVDTNIGDTRSVSGIFRALRNIPLMLEISNDISKYCPNAIFINYTNPMSILCKAMQSYTNVNVTGLCHSVQGTIKMLTEWLELPLEDVAYKCAGVNHQAFYLEIKHNGEDIYPKLREKLKDETFYNKELVRNEMFLQLDYYPTESSGHNSEYNQWFRKRPDLIEKYCTHGTNWNPGVYAFSLNHRLKNNWRTEYEKWINTEEVDKNRSLEYGSNIFNACFGDNIPFEFNGNVINNGCIENLPADACVEIPMFATKNGFKQTFVGKMPEHLAILLNTTSMVENLVVEAAMEKNKRKLFHAVCLDPLTSAVCSLEEIKQMTDELFEINKDYLGDYK